MKVVYMYRGWFKKWGLRERPLPENGGGVLSRGGHSLKNGGFGPKSIEKGVFRSGKAEKGGRKLRGGGQRAGGFNTAHARTGLIVPMFILT